jgi:hypothetical protein
VTLKLFWQMVIFSASDIEDIIVPFGVGKILRKKFAETLSVPAVAEKIQTVL